MYRDVRGVAVTAASPAAVGAYDATLRSYLRFGGDTGELLKATGQTDPDMPMGTCLRGYFFNLMGAAALRPRAAKLAEQAKAQAARGTEREKLHATALAA